MQRAAAQKSGEAPTDEDEDSEDEEDFDPNAEEYVAVWVGESISQAMSHLSFTDKGSPARRALVKCQL